MDIPFLRSLALAVTLSMGAMSGAHATQYTTFNPEASTLTFGYSQMNVNMDGRFGQMQATEFSFDPQDPESARVGIEITLASVDAGYDEANAELGKDEWLALGQHPLATFTSKKVETLPDGRYQVTGDLSIKGKSQEVTAPFTFKEDGDAGVFEGGFTFQRADFDIGEGQWKDFSIVANDITIEFKMVATP